MLSALLGACAGPSPGASDTHDGSVGSTGEDLCEAWVHPPPPARSWCSGLEVMDDLDGRRVAITFDDGPSSRTTPAILGALRAADVPATFFVVGRMLEDARQRELLREIHADPLFDVANHSYTHPDSLMLSVEELESEVHETNEAIRASLGDPCYFPRYYRFPYGSANCRETRAPEAFGMAVAGFDIDVADWCFDEEGRCEASRATWIPPQYLDDMIGFLLARLEEEDGGIVLLHDVMPYTAAVLPELLERVRAAGFTFVRLEELPRLNDAVNPPEPPMCCHGEIH
ncbi:polysaccharide deacetylase family protein [Sandaracinus amylolyticus]|uniref:polysaccharide deacetylase family protein n=1 Tax=Sandaracinus amylolyticus TaxID=927083 RepID=UPI001F1765CB|nr:polysaccharide deacetylase family protein [Sandaracinus amylolyticus]UJR83127.1 Hypothetical protein I5071_51930 [Sandaracinus amylolyticus]